MTAQESHALVMENLGWAKSKGLQLMRGSRTRALSWDIEQVAVEGLIEAARDWSGEGEFRAYAYVAIRNQVIDAIRKVRRVEHYEIPMEMSVMDWLAAQDRAEWDSWERHVPSVGSIRCERDPLSPPLTK